MMILVNKPFSDQALADSPSLDLRNIGTSIWPRLLRICHAKELRLYHITLKSLNGVEALTATRQLTLEWATKIEQLDPVFHLQHLSRLSVYDFPRLRTLTGIERLQDLTELNLSGSRGAINPPLRLATLAPVTLIPNLTSFSLGNARLDDGDITCLSKCSRLRDLSLSKNFDRSQFAFLAKRLNPQLETPITAHVVTNLQCEHCGGHKAMFLGQRMPFLCPACDEARFHKLEEEFESLTHKA
jgi:Leucine-rich repeat (LRR) protein